jgi:Domain of unknown function (DUF4388)
MEDRPLLSGRLEEVHFPELLHEVSKRKQTGVLHVIRQGINKDIFFDQGHVVFAKSNDPDDRLGELLLRQGKITYHQLDEAAQKIAPERRLGTILVQEKTIKPSDLYHGVISQVEEIIYSLFEWSDGNFAFIVGDLPSNEVITLGLSPADLVLTGIGRIQRWSWVRKATGSLDTVYMRKGSELPSLKKVTLSPRMRWLLDFLVHPVSLRTILEQSEGDNFETCKLLWALLILELAHEKAPPSVEDTQPQTPATLEPEPFKMEEPIVALTASPQIEDPEAPFGTMIEEPPAPAPAKALEPEPEPVPEPEPEPERKFEPEPMMESKSESELESESESEGETELVADPEPEPHPHRDSAISDEPTEGQKPTIILDTLSLPLPGSAPDTPSPGVELSFSDFADLTDAVEPPATSQPPAPPVWEQNVERDIRNFNEKHRYLFEMLRIEMGAGVVNFFGKIMKKASSDFPLVFEGVQLNEYGELNPASLLANIGSNLFEGYPGALEDLFREERNRVAALLEQRRLEMIETGIARIEEVQKTRDQDEPKTGDV